MAANVSKGGSSFLRINLQGDRELRQFFSNLTNRQTSSFLRRTLKDAAKPVVQAVKNATPVGPTGNLKRSIGLKDIKPRWRHSPLISMFIGARMKRKEYKDYRTGAKKQRTARAMATGSGHHGAFVAYGTRGSRGRGNWIDAAASKEISSLSAKFITKWNLHLDKEIRKYMAKAQHSLYGSNFNLYER